MWTGLISVAWLLAGLLFVGSLRGLSSQETARSGNLLGAVGMGLAILATFVAIGLPEVGKEGADTGAWIGLLGAVAIGSAIGAGIAARVAMTSMPELVAVLHSFVGLAAVFVGVATTMHGEGDVAHRIETSIGVFVGAITFTGSVVAFLKLRGTLASKPLLLPGRHLINALLLLATLVIGVAGGGQVGPLLVITAIAFLLGAHLVMAIGGGDMPVVVSLLNSYSGWAAAAAGFMLSNDLLILTGALVGSSGAILSTIMCRAMNRSIWNVVFGGFGEAPVASSGASKIEGKVTETQAQEVSELLISAKSVIIVPGYGMAVAQAQHAVKEITSVLHAKGVRVRYAIHPVAGRLPGHMNVLLAEANVPYDLVEEMEEINEDFPETDVVVVIGANDIVNPSALDDTSSPIYGMPVLEAWKAGVVIMMKRSMNAGYAGVENPLCYRENTRMLFGDAKQSVLNILAALQQRAAA